MRPLRAAVLAGVALLSSSAGAGDKPIVIGEVSSQVARVGVDYAALLRSVSEQEVRALDVSHVPRGKRVIVSVALVRMRHVRRAANDRRDMRSERDSSRRQARRRLRDSRGESARQERRRDEHRGALGAPGGPPRRARAHSGRPPALISSPPRTK